MKFYIIAGEASGDLHAANLIRAMKEQEPAAEFRGFGGDKMTHAGCEVVKHYRDLAFMGFWEVAVNIRTILRNLDFCKQDILRYKPDAVILVDYPGFNLRIAEFLKVNGLKVFYYISPQVWAWKASRVKLIRQCVDKMFVILPFEKEFYARWDYKVDFVGHPLLDELANKRHDSNFIATHQFGNRKIIALLPGSRKQEISRMLPVMAEMARHFPEYQFVVAGLTNIGEQYYRALVLDAEVKLVMNQTYALLDNSYAALVTSGTATLETALFNVPQVVCYRGSFFSYLIGRMLVKVKFISLVNLVSDKKVVEELIQNDFNVERLKSELNRLLSAKGRDQLLADYQVLKNKLGGAGASKKTATLMLQAMRSR